MTNSKKAFIEKTYNFDDNIKFVRGNHDKYVFVGFENELRVFICKDEVKPSESGQNITFFKEIEQIDQKVIPNLKTISLFRKLGENE